MKRGLGRLLGGKVAVVLFLSCAVVDCSSGGYFLNEDGGAVDAADRMDGHLPLDAGAAGDLASARCTPTQGHRAVAQLSLGETSACALYASGSVVCWGGNSYGELGDGLTKHVDCGGSDCAKAPVLVQGITDAVQAASGGFFACAVHATGKVSCWGSDILGNLGDGLGSHDTSCMDGCSRVPVAVAGLNDAVQVTAGMYGTACALRRGGSVVCWGNNDYGQLGDGGMKHATCRQYGHDHDCSRTPVAVLQLTDAVELHMGGPQVCARRANGHVVCWGDNGAGQLGDTTTVSHPSPTEVSGLTDATSIAVGAHHACAARQGGQVMCWGGNGAGELGDGSVAHKTCAEDKDCSPTPVAVKGLTDARAVSGQWLNNCALRADQSVVCWGENGSLQLGDGVANHMTCPGASDCSATPIAVKFLSGIIELNVAGAASCALRADCTAACWGVNGSAQLGDGTTTPRPFPSEVVGL